MAQGVLTTPGVRALRMPRVFEIDALTFAVVGAWVALLALALPWLFVSDSWLALVDGRFLVQHGLPHSDTLTTWSAGTPWVDQQWGAQLALYGLVAAGGLAAAAVLGIACIAATLGVTALAARQLGGSPRSTAVAVALPLLAAPWLAQLRTQTLALPLFAAVWLLLTGDSRRGGRRVLLVLPLLLVWANLHGSAALAAALAAAYGATIVRRRRAVGLALLASPLTLLASPYGVGLVGYYRLMLVSPPLAKVVSEWRPMPVRVPTIAFFLTAFLLVALYARYRRSLTGFEQWALVPLLVAAFAAARNAVWFELALAVALPRLLDAWRPAVPPDEGVRRINRVLAPAVICVVVVFVAVQAAKPVVTPGSARAAAAVSRAAGPHGLVLADDRHADWLLWQRPELAGRIAYDVRFELFDARQLRTIIGLDHGLRAPWMRCGRAMSVVTFEDASRRDLYRAQGVLGSDAQLVANTPTFGAFAQTPRGAACRL